MTIFSIIAVPGLDDEQRLAELHGLAILDQYGFYLARFFRLNLIHHFHGLDDTQHLADLDRIADFNKRFGARGGGRVVSTDHRCRGDMLLGGRARRAAGRLGAGRRGFLEHSCGAAWRQGGRSRRCPLLAGHHSGDAQGFFAFLDLDLGDARFLEQLDHLLDLANVHQEAPVVGRLPPSHPPAHTGLR